MSTRGAGCRPIQLLRNRLGLLVDSRGQGGAGGPVAYCATNTSTVIKFEVVISDLCDPVQTPISLDKGLYKHVHLFCLTFSANVGHYTALIEAYRGLDRVTMVQSTKEGVRGTPMPHSSLGRNFVGTPFPRLT